MYILIISYIFYIYIILAFSYVFKVKVLLPIFAGPLGPLF